MPNKRSYAGSAPTKRSYGGSSPLSPGEYPAALTGGGAPAAWTPGEYTSSTGGKRRTRKSRKSRKAGGGVLSSALVPLSLLGLLGAKQMLGKNRLSKYKNKVASKFRSTRKTLRRRFRR